MLSLVLWRNGGRYWAEPLVQLTLTEPALLPFLLPLRATVRRGGFAFFVPSWGEDWGGFSSEVRSAVLTSVGPNLK